MGFGNDSVEPSGYRRQFVIVTEIIQNLHSETYLKAYICRIERDEDNIKVNFMEN